MKFFSLGRLLALMLAAVAMAAIAGCGSDDGDSGGGDNGASSDETAKVMVVNDISGPTAETQVPYEAGSKAFFDKYAEEGEGVKIEVTYEDDQYDAAQALNLYRQAESNGTVGVIGANASATAPALVQAGMTVPVISGVTSTILDADYLWNLLPTFTDQANIMLNYAIGKLDDVKVAALYFDVPSGVEFADALEEAAKEAGVEFVGKVSIAAEEAAGDWRAQAQRLAELKPTFVGVLASAANPQTFLPAMANAGLDDVMVGAVTPLGLYADNWLSVPPKLGEQFFAISSISPADIETAGSAEIVEAAKATGKPEYANNLYFVQGWVAAKLMAEAINNAEELTPEGVNAALAQIQDFDSGGLNPPICFGDDDHYGTGMARPIRVNLDTKKFEAIGEFEDYQQYVKTPNGTC